MCYITIIHISYDKIGISTLFWHGAKAAMIIDHCTQHEQNPLIHLKYITTTYKMYAIMDITSTF